MTHSDIPHARPRTYVLVGLLFVLAAALGIGLAQAYVHPAVASTSGPAAARPVQMRTVDAIPASTLGSGAAQAVAFGRPVPRELLAVAIGQSGDFTQAQAEEILLAADRVCEALYAQVPVTEQVSTLMAQEGMTGEQAMAFVNTAALVNCQPTAAGSSL